MNKIFFITGIGTGVGKTLVSKALVQALNAAYWKPIQAGTQNSDSQTVIKTPSTPPLVFPESYALKLPASPHLAAKKQNITITLQKIKKDFLSICKQLPPHKTLIIEGAGGLLSPINNHQQNLHLIMALKVPVIIVSRNYLGSINHSLLTAHSLQHHQCPILGWVFNDTSMGYENQIVKWTKIPLLFSLPKIKNKTIPQNLQHTIQLAFKKTIK